VEELGIGFCFAPLFHGSMKHAMPVRKVLGFRTLFNLLGPLTNPAGADYQLLGVSTISAAKKVASALAQLGRKRALVVCGAGHLDEVSLWGETTVYRVEQGSVTQEVWTPQSLGLPECRVEDLQVHSAEESAAIITHILEGETGPPRDIVIANAAAALWAAGKVKSLEEGVTLARDAIAEGLSANLLEQLKTLTNSSKTR
jgi:anthranilate phosphoribosyltransferase